MFRNLLTRLFADDTEERRIDSGDAEVALAALLVRVARADDRYDRVEQHRIEQILARRRGLSGPQAAERVEANHDTDTLRQWLLTALSALNDRERFIVRERKLRDEPRTLESLGDELGLSKERVRQLEAAAFGKMRRSLETQSREVMHFFN